MQSQQMSDPLAQLKDIQTPDAVAMWPLGWGWWVVIALTVLALTATVWWLYRRYRFYRGRREALEQLKRLSAQHTDWPGAMNAVLKRTALTYYDPRHVASLHGMMWVAFLRGKLSAKHLRRYADGLSLLNNSLYITSVNDSDFAVCHAACIGWVRHANLRAKTVPHTFGHEAHHV